MAKRIKILHIINDLGVGGAQRVVADIVKNLDRRRYYPMVCNLNLITESTIEKEIISTSKTGNYELTNLNGGVSSMSS